MQPFSIRVDTLLRRNVRMSRDKPLTFLQKPDTFLQNGKWSIGRDGQLRTSLYNKRDDFNFHITNFLFLSSNIPSSHTFGVFISQLIRYTRTCSSYECFILRAVRLSNKLLGQGYVKERLNSSLRKFYGRYGYLTKQSESPSPEC